ncbi:hypothetical protein [Rugosimonospora africana]|uniref:hypothetical protein n=1 Tax=Rugosimonospora africana TaxID=556532 RepID=UPI001944B724|nr:hypothetical protein [Rugosimonospora africana]
MASPTPSPSPTGEPRTYEAAKAAVVQLEAAAARADGGALWDLLTATGQAAITRADYIKVTNACPGLAKSEKYTAIALNDAGNIATVTVTVSEDYGGGTATYSMIYEAGRWKHQPSDSALSWMSLGGDKAVLTLKNEGYC